VGLLSRKTFNVLGKRGKADEMPGQVYIYSCFVWHPCVCNAQGSIPWSKIGKTPLSVHGSIGFGFASH